MAKKKSNTSLWLMLVLILAIIAALFLMPSCVSSGKDTQPDIETSTLVKAGEQAPDFTVTMFDGSQASLSALRGKVVLLTFWASWCPSCIEELSHVQSQVIDRFAGRNFVFLPISRGEERSAIEAFRQKTGHTFAMGLDPQQTIYNRYASNYVPRNFLIGADGKVIAATTGFDQTEFKALIQTIENTLQQQ